MEQAISSILEDAMNNPIYRLIALVFTLSAFSLSQAGTYKDIHDVDDYIANMTLKYTIGLRYGSPTTKQILPINTKEFYFQRRLRSPNGSLMVPAMEFSVSQLNVGEEHGYVYGFGPVLNIPIGGTLDRLYFTAQGKVHYLTRNDFGRKRYGGPVQWTYAFGIRSDLTVNTFASYAWQHMSNGDVYEYNPALETHTITLGVRF